MSDNLKIRQLNFSVLYGVVEKKKKNAVIINYGAGRIKVLLDNIENYDTIEENYTISVSGYLKQGWIKTNLIATQVSIFDKSPHFIDMGAL